MYYITNIQLEHGHDETDPEPTGLLPAPKHKEATPRSIQEIFQRNLKVEHEREPNCVLTLCQDAESIIQKLHGQKSQYKKRGTKGMRAAKKAAKVDEEIDDAGLASHVRRCNHAR